MKLELYYFEGCPYCQLVLKKINALNIKDKIIFKNIQENSEYRQFHLTKTGRTTVPCLYIDQEPLFESQDICRWLESNVK